LRYGSIQQPQGQTMIDNFAIGVTHFLMMIAVLRLLFRPDLDKEEKPRHMEIEENTMGSRRA
jgi:hypothetical protein